MIQENPNVLAARAADGAGLSNLPLAISFPGAAANLATVHTCIGDFIPVVFRRWHHAPGFP
ncbi:MAG: hypothetical protein OXD42_06805, partial [Rhodospirillaceae bacterium]|nr:hypothetical protein [Rhodospirillaceae bacterium]